MGFRKTLVKLMNLVYIAGCGVAIYGICTKPIVNVDLGVELTSKQVGTYVAKAFGVENKESKAYTVRITRAEESGDSFKDWLTEEKIANAFPDGIKLHQPIQVPLAKAFEFKNDKILQETVVENLDAFIKAAVDAVAPGVHELFKEAAEDKAKEVLEDKINETISEFFGDDESQQVSKDEVQEIFDNIYALVEDNAASADDITQAILGDDETSAGLQKILADRAEANGGMQVASNVTEEEYNAEAAKAEDERLLFTRDETESDPPTYTPVQPGEYNAETTYYEAYDSSKIDGEKISDALIEQLDTFDGMIDRTGTYELCDPQPTEIQYNQHKGEDGKNTKYFVVDGEEHYVAAEGDYNPSTQYYKEIVMVNDVDSALAYLLDKILNGDSSSNKATQRVVRGEPEKSEADVRKVLNDYIHKVIPVEAIKNVSATVGNKAAYALLGLLAFFMLPWAWFALLTFVRTFRRLKIWTRTWMVFVLALPQLILGIVLRYGTTGILAALGNKIEVLKTVSEIFKPTITFNCFWASFVYLAMVPMTIVYVILARPFKSQWRFEKQLRIHDRARAQMEARKRR